MQRLTGATPKRFTRGTHRSLAPTETHARLQRLLPVFGITRVANVTGLDEIGIPVVMVCRPNSRSLAVFQGKGQDLLSATVSGLMEAIESFHAERISLPLRYASYDDLRHTEEAVDPGELPRQFAADFDQRHRMLWVQGTDLAGDQACWVPLEVVSLDFTLPLPTGSGSLLMSSNGLGSGNNEVEAIVHAVCELIERDATTLWYQRDAPTRARTRIDLDSITSPQIQDLLSRFSAAGLEVSIWDTTSDVAVPCLMCLVDDAQAGTPPSGGMGCHPDREVALSRAITEAAQSRLTHIAGARDDVGADKYPPLEDLPTARRRGGTPAGLRSFAELPTFQGATLEEDARYLLARLSGAGLDQVVIVDLSRPEFPVRVVRAVVPGLEGIWKTVGYVPGKRARAGGPAQ